jgi:hypothetical protein
MATSLFQRRDDRLPCERESSVPGAVVDAKRGRFLKKSAPIVRKV